MSKVHSPRGIKQPVSRMGLPSRVSRHGKLLTEVYMIAIPPTTERKILLNPVTNEYEPTLVVISKGGLRPMTEEEIRSSRAMVHRAQGSTNNYGKRNTPPTRGKKS